VDSLPRTLRCETTNPDEEVVGVRILIVDDEPTVAEALAEAVRRQGYETALIHQGADSLAAIRRHRPDGIFLDLIMPGMSGLEVLRRIRMEWPDLPVVVVTGYPDDEDAQEAQRLGIVAVVEKPTIIKNLTAVLDNLRDR
jgi:two-component system OmpR family response regulator